MNVSRFSLSSPLAYTVPLASVAMAKHRLGKLVDNNDDNAIKAEDLAPIKEEMVADTSGVSLPTEKQTPPWENTLSEIIPEQSEKVAPPVTDVVSISTQSQSASVKPKVATAQQPQAVKEKKEKQSDWVPSAIALGLVGTAATVGVILPQWLEENKPLEQRHKDFMKKLSSMKPYSVEEFEGVKDDKGNYKVKGVRGRAIEILDRLRGAEGDEWLKKEPQTQFFLDSLVNRTPENLEASYKAYKRQLIMESLNAKYGKYTLVKSDVDGTAEFKDFSNHTNGVSELTPANFSLGQGYELSVRAKSKAALEFGEKNAENPSYTLTEMVQEMKELGMYGATTTLKDGSIVLEDAFSETMLTRWTQNTEKAFKILKGEALKRFMEGVSLALVTARAGGSGTVFEAGSPNPITGAGLGKDNKYQNRPFGGAPQLLKMDPTNCYNHVNTYGIGGAYVVDRQLICPMPFADSSLFGLPDMLVEAGILDAVYESSDSPLRQVEPKGVLTGWMKDIMVEYLSTKVNEIETARDKEKQLNDIFDVLVSNCSDKPEAGQAESPRALMKKIIENQWKHAGKGDNPTKEALLNRYYMTSESMHDFALPQAWEGKMNQVFEVALDCADKIEKGIPVTKEGHPKTMKEVGEYLKNHTRKLEPADYDYFNIPFSEAVKEDGSIDFISHHKRVRFAKEATDSVTSGDKNFQAPVGKTQLAKIEAFASKGENLTINELKAFNKELMTVDIACLTVHTIEAELDGLFVDIKKAEHLFSKGKGSNPTDIKLMILETQKWKVLKRIIELEDNPDIKRVLKDLGYAGILRVSSSEEKLCYPSGDVPEGSRYLINMVNNSSALNLAHYLQDERLDDAMLAKIVKEAGVNLLADPTGSYVESVLNQALDKGAVLNFINNISVLEAFAGDSTGTDRAAICKLLAETPIHTSFVVRNMITDPQMLSGLVDALNIEASTCAALLKAYKKQFKKNKVNPDDQKLLIDLNETQLKANPLRYKYQKLYVKDADGNLVQAIDPKTKKPLFDKEGNKIWKIDVLKDYVVLVGDGHKDLLPYFKNTTTHADAINKEDIAIPIDDYKQVVKNVYQGLIMERCIRADDVPFNHLRSEMVLGLLNEKVWGTDFNTYKELRDNHYLAQKAILYESTNSALPFFRKNPFAFSLGMPHDATFASEKFLPANLAALEKDPALRNKLPNVFGLVHMAALSVGKTYLNANAIGGIMALTGGAIAIGTAVYQLVSVWNKPVAKLPMAQPTVPLPAATVVPPASVVNNPATPPKPIAPLVPSPSPTVPTEKDASSTTTAEEANNSSSNTVTANDEPLQALSKQLNFLRTAATSWRLGGTAQVVASSSQLSLPVEKKDLHRRVVGYQQQQQSASTADAPTFSTQG